ASSRRRDGTASTPHRAPTRRSSALYSDARQYALEQQRIFKGPTWNYLCLAVEVHNPGDYLVTGVGESSVVDQKIAGIVDLNCERSEEHTSELQSRFDLVCRLLLEKR